MLKDDSDANQSLISMLDNQRFIKESKKIQHQPPPPPSQPPKNSPPPQPTQPAVNDEIKPPASNIKSQPQSQKKAQKKGNKKKSKKSKLHFTHILKVLNIISGLVQIAFGIWSYYDLNKQDNTQQKKPFSLIGLILPGYIAFSGLIILAIQVHIKFICRNMKFLYNYFGRGFFNIYVGIMPLSLIQSQDQPLYEKIFTYGVVGLLVFVGLLYIMAKVFCCAKQGQKRKKISKKKKNQGSDSDSQESSSSQSSRQ